MQTKAELLIATHNPAKLSEIKYFLKSLPLRLLSLAELNITEEVKEDGRTFAENAVKKARYYAQQSGLPTLADDGGIEIDYLGGQPGVHSRRWIGGKKASDEMLIRHTLKLLHDVPEQQRGAQLCAVIALVLSNGLIYTAAGKIRGIIMQEAYAGKRWQGFPFRSLFYIEEIGKYYNPEQMNQEEEIEYNHRRDALTKLIPIIQAKLI